MARPSTAAPRDPVSRVRFPPRARGTAGPVAASDRGAAALWVVAACVLIAVIAEVVVVRTGAVLARHRAESAADLAALAGAGRIGVGGVPCAAAAAIATANGTSLTACAVALGPGGRSGTVDVRVTAVLRLPVVGRRTVTASARAGRLPAGAPAAGPAAGPVDGSADGSADGRGP